MPDTQISAKAEMLLKHLSERIRGFRAARGMTRKDLARHAGVSERYLAQLEDGKANPSVDVLWRIAEAMSVNLNSLLTEPDRPALSDTKLWQFLHTLDANQQQAAYTMLRSAFTGARRHDGYGVALIGLRGAGKTTLGRRVAQELGTPFVRLGEVIQQIGAMELWEIFSLAGQKTYRRLERQALEQVLKEQPGAILEAGGSIVSEPATFDLLLSSCFTIWVRASPEEHMGRVARQGDLRPMQGNQEAMADLKRILREREPDYARADCVLDTRNRDVDACLRELTHIVTKHLSLQTDTIPAQANT